jgi:hypothetical protein
MLSKHPHCFTDSVFTTPQPPPPHLCAADAEPQPFLHMHCFTHIPPDTWVSYPSSQLTLYQHPPLSPPLTCLLHMLSPSPVPPRVRGLHISSSVPCTYSRNSVARPSRVMPTPAPQQQQQQRRSGSLEARNGSMATARPCCCQFTHASNKRILINTRRIRHLHACTQHPGCPSPLPQHPLLHPPSPPPPNTTHTTPPQCTPPPVSSTSNSSQQASSALARLL